MKCTRELLSLSYIINIYRLVKIACIYISISYQTFRSHLLLKCVSYTYLSLISIDYEYHLIVV